MKTVYQKAGFRDRAQYLSALAEDFDVPLDVVESLADCLGEESDFDDLVETLKDYPFKGFQQ